MIFLVQHAAGRTIAATAFCPRSIKRPFGRLASNSCLRWADEAIVTAGPPMTIAGNGTGMLRRRETRLQPTSKSQRLPLRFPPIAIGGRLSAHDLAQRFRHRHALVLRCLGPAAAGGRLGLWPNRGFGFVNIDDDKYVYNTPQISHGLTPRALFGRLPTAIPKTGIRCVALAHARLPALRPQRRRTSPDQRPAARRHGGALVSWSSGR